MAGWIEVGGSRWQLVGRSMEDAKDLLADALSREGTQELKVRHEGVEASLLLSGRSLQAIVMWEDAS